MKILTGLEPKVSAPVRIPVSGTKVAFLTKGAATLTVPMMSGIETETIWVVTFGDEPDARKLVTAHEPEVQKRGARFRLPSEDYSDKRLQYALKSLEVPEDALVEVSHDRALVQDDVKVTYWEVEL